MTARSTTKDFIEKAIRIHGDKYDYSLVVYTRSCDKVRIVCPIHGEFLKTPNKHLGGSGCAECSRKNITSDTATFVQKATTIHGNRWDYSKVEYETVRKKVVIICPQHGEFKQTPFVHLQGKGCLECGYITRNNKNLRNTDIFIQKAIEVHGDRYDYSKVEYELGVKRVNIICKTHGIFHQTPSSHLQGHGCLQCKYETSRRSVEDFIEKAMFTHNSFYDYSLVEYEKGSTKVQIICPTHGVFQQAPTSHLGGQGCPSCCISGFDPCKPAILYYVRIDCGELDYPVYKIGITNRSVAERFSYKEYNMMTEFEITHYTVGRGAFDKEKEILESFKDYKYLGDPILTSGNSEIFVYDVLNADKDDDCG